MFKFAAIQMASGPNVAGNLNEVDRLISQAADLGANLVVLPENFAFMGMQESDVLSIAEQPDEGPIQDFLRERARQHQIWIVGGTLPLVADTQHVFASCLTFNAAGELAARYDKHHLFDVSIDESEETYKESDTIAPGSQHTWLDSPFGRIGFSVCYDIRFPELYRQWLETPVDVIVVPSAFTATTGKAHWEPLIRARAIENLCYVVAPNQGGYHVNGRETYGDSMIVSPWGEVLDRLARGSGVVIADIDLDNQHRLRQTFPVLQHRRINIGNANE